MGMTISIVDETSSGQSISGGTFEVGLDAITLRELIRRRVQFEVEAFNRLNPEVFQGLVQPEESERILNGYKLKETRKLDWQKQFQKAIHSFERNGFLVLLNDRQITGLDDELHLSSSSQFRFLRLTPLVGG